MDTLPRFRFPDEKSSGSDVSRAGGPWEDFDDLDQLETCVRAKDEGRDDHGFDAIPTVVRPSLGRKVIARGRLEAVSAANVDDVVEELRAAAAGRKPRVREIESREVLDVEATDEVQQVDESELVFDRAVPRRDVWNVRQVSRVAAPRPSIVGPTPAPTSRFLATAALAMLGGALLAVGVALLVWRLGGFSL